LEPCPSARRDPSETVMGDAFGHVDDEIEQVLDLDVDRARKVHVMGFVAERNNGHQKNVAFCLLRRRLADVPDQDVVGIQGQMWAVILNGSYRQYHDRLTFRRLAQFRPGVVLVEIAFTNHMHPSPFVRAFADR
jgi:hypothetical protein